MTPRPAVRRRHLTALLAAAAALVACGPLAPETGDGPAVRIVAPEDSAVVRLGVNRPLRLRGEATDPQEGALTGDALRWRSDRDGPLGRGREVALERLSVGLHRLTLIAADAEGNSASVTHRVVVDAIVGPRVLLAPDTLALTSLEDTASFAATVLRSRGDTAEAGAVEVRWSSADTAVAVSIGGGRFAPRGNGRTVITARALDAPGRAVLEVRDGWMRVTAGGLHTCGLTTDSLAYCWGEDGSGQLGDGGTREERPAPVPVAGDRRFAAIDAGEAHTCAIAADGALLCWGANDRGQLGTGDTRGSAEPARVQAIEPFRDVSAGGRHTCGITAVGETLCWGAGDRGQLGFGGTSDRLTPIRVAQQDFRGVGGGGEHTCGVSSSSVMACWGANGRGQLGTGDTFDRVTPSPQEEIRAFERVVGGRLHACALSGGGSAFCWGANGNGQIGDGTRRDRLTRAGVQGGGRFESIAAGGRHSCAIRGDGALFCWGENRDGQLGDGSGRDRLSPVRIAREREFRSVTGGGRHTCAVTRDWGAYCWGAGGSGQLGTDDRSSSLRPVPVVTP